MRNSLNRANELHALLEELNLGAWRLCVQISP